MAPLHDRMPNRIRSLLGRSAAQGSFIRKYFKLHAIHPPNASRPGLQSKLPIIQNTVYTKNVYTRNDNQN
jgi:hypothetical protein